MSYCQRYVVEVQFWLLGDQGEKEAKELLRQILSGMRMIGRQRTGWIWVRILEGVSSLEGKPEGL